MTRVTTPDGATNWARYSFPNAAGLNGYVLQAGDKLYFRQYQAYSTGGMELSFTDATTTRGQVNDQDGYPINADPTAGVTRYRRVDLSALAGKTVSGVALWVENGSAWDFYFNEISLVSADGTVRPIYDRQKTVSLVSEGTAPNRNWQVNHFNGTGSLGWMTASHYYHGDHLGSSRLLSSVAGLPLWQTTYLSYGQELNPQATINRYKFNGKERDSETTLDNFGARYYSSQLGRFTSPDWAAAPTSVPYADFGNPQSLNLYTYVGNNPITRFDVDGHCWPVSECVTKFQNAVDSAAQKVTDAAANTGNAGLAQTVSAVVGTGKDLVSGTADMFRAGEAVGACLDNCNAVQMADAVGQDLNRIAGLVATAALVAGTAETAVARLKPGATTEPVTPNAAGAMEPHPSVTRPYARPSGATTAEQRQNANEVVDAVNSHCPTCSARSGGKLARFAKDMKKIVEDR